MLGILILLMLASFRLDKENGRQGEADMNHDNVSLSRASLSSCLASQLAQPNALHLVVAALFEYQACPPTRWRNIRAQVDGVDFIPDARSDLPGLILRQIGVAAKVRCPVTKRCLAQPQEALDIPLVQVQFVGIYIDRE